MKKTAIYPGTFDPVTKGHEALVLRALPIFDEIIIAIGKNSKKDNYFPIENRLEWLETVFKNYAQITISQFSGLTVDYCKKVGANFILRGLRSSADFEFERSIAQANNTLNNQVESIFLISSPGLSNINSSIVRDVHRNKGDIKPFLPESLKIQNF